MTPQEKLDALGETWAEFRFACADRLAREQSVVCVNGYRPSVEYPCINAATCPRLNRDTKPEREG